MSSQTGTSKSGMSVCISIAIIAFAVALPGSTAAYTHKTLHNFCVQANCTDGSNPAATLLLHGGNLYGTTESGGTYNNGVVFKYDLSTAKFTVLHEFKNKTHPKRLIIDVDGNLYGTTELGGGVGGENCAGETCGQVYELSPGSPWTFTQIYGFDGGSHGGAPDDGLTYAGESTGAAWNKSTPLYGTAANGGLGDNGVAFQLTHSGSWSLTVIHNFQSSDGNSPLGLTVDGAGNPIGTTIEGGGAVDQGVIFKLAHGTWQETVLRNFCKKIDCTDGARPQTRPLVDSTGNIFGTTTYGGIRSCVGGFGCGVAFKRTAAGTYQVIHTFCAKANCSDGGEPNGDLIMDSSGNLFGTAVLTNGGNPPSYGVAFKLSHASGKWIETPVYTFCHEAGCTDGYEPLASVVMDSSGHLFGTTALGGTHSSGSMGGTLYELLP